MVLKLKLATEISRGPSCVAGENALHPIVFRASFPVYLSDHEINVSSKIKNHNKPYRYLTLA